MKNMKYLKKFENITNELSLEENIKKAIDNKTGCIIQQHPGSGTFYKIKNYLNQNNISFDIIRLPHMTKLDIINIFKNKDTLQNVIIVDDYDRAVSDVKEEFNKILSNKEFIFIIVSNEMYLDSLKYNT